VKARVFEPFFTTKDVGKGSGLGLAQVYGFARQSGGTVAVESALGKGTSISLVLPRSLHEVPDHPAGGLRDHVPDRDGSGCVLVVEDDTEVAALVQDMLRNLGYDVIHAASAEAALGALANGRQLDLIVSDIMMPGGTSGIELAREVKRRRPGLPILLTSGYAERNRSEAIEMGIPVLAKPYGIDDLRATLTQVLEDAASA
jgi:CheY-like chemotaxis protein